MTFWNNLFKNHETANVSSCLKHDIMTLGEYQKYLEQNFEENLQKMAKYKENLTKINENLEMEAKSLLEKKDQNTKNMESMENLAKLLKSALFFENEKQANNENPRQSFFDSKNLKNNSKFGKLSPSSSSIPTNYSKLEEMMKITSKLDEFFENFVVEKNKKDDKIIELMQELDKFKKPSENHDILTSFHFHKLSEWIEESMNEKKDFKWDRIYLGSRNGSK